MQAPASPRRAAGLAPSKSSMPEDHPLTPASGSMRATPLGLRRRRGSLTAMRRPGSGRGRRTVSGVLGGADSGLHALFPPQHCSSSSLEVDGAPSLPLQRMQTAGSMLNSGVGSSGSLGYSGLHAGSYSSASSLGQQGLGGSGLLHAQSSTINLAGQVSASLDVATRIPA